MSGRLPTPPIPRPPHDPTSWLLNSVVGWRAATPADAEQVLPAQALQLAIATGTGRSLTEPSGSFGGLTLPTNVALGPDGSIYLLDAATLQLKRFDPCWCRFEIVPCFGGEGSGARQLRDPHGIGICAGNLFVCDTGNRRVSVFSLRGFVLRGHWRPSDPQVAGVWQPWDLTFDSRGRLYVTDPGSGSIHRFTAGGRSLPALAGLGSVRSIASDCRDYLHVVRDGIPADVIRLTTDGEPVSEREPSDALAAHFPPLPFAVDAEGRLRLAALCPPADPCAPAPRGAPAVFDLHGELIEDAPALPSPTYAMKGTFRSEALDSALYRCQWHRVVLRGEIPAGASVEVATFTSEVDDESQVQGLPADAWSGNTLLRPFEPGAAPERRKSGALCDRPVAHASAVSTEWDCLVRSDAGRYLWLRLTLRGNGKVTPRIDSISIEFPRISLRRYLPAVFGEEPTSADFTDRFLSLFDTTLRSFETKIDHLARYFDPSSAPAERDPATGTDFLSWLASWVGVSLERHWPEPKRRRFLKEAGKLFDIRGTRHALWRQLVLLLGMEPQRVRCPERLPPMRCEPKPLNCAPVETAASVWQPPPLILEHYQLRRWLFVGAGRLGNEAVLWGRRIVNRTQLGEEARVGHSQLKTTQDPYRDPFHHYAHKFTVFVPGRYGQCQAHRRALVSLLRAESPAQTQYDVCYVEPRFRVGFQSMIGLDSVVARLPKGVQLRQSPLGRASVLTPPPHEQGGPSIEIGKEGRIGTTTKLD